MNEGRVSVSNPIKASRRNSAMAASTPTGESMTMMRPVMEQRGSLFNVSESTFLLTKDLNSVGFMEGGHGREET